MGAGEKKKARNFGPPAYGPPPFEPPRCGLQPLGQSLFLRLAPPFWATLPAEALQAPHFFWVWAPTFLIKSQNSTVLLLCMFNCFYFLSFFDFFFEIVTVFVFVGIFFRKPFKKCFFFFFFTFFSFFQVGRKRERGKPKTQTSFQFGREGGRRG